jgi:hypothetical protein
MGASNWVHVVAERITGETEKCFFVVIEGTQYNIPKSQMADPNNYSVGDEDATISITQWLAGQEGISGD